jgi:pentatricopeptide repeat protein
MVNEVQELWNTMQTRFSFKSRFWMIKLYTTSNNVDKAVYLRSNDYVYTLLIGKCAKLGSIALVERVLKHVENDSTVIQQKIQQNIILNNILINVYGSNGELEKVCGIFDKITIRQSDGRSYNDSARAKRVAEHIKRLRRD